MGYCNPFIVVVGASSPQFATLHCELGEATPTTKKPVKPHGLTGLSHNNF
jgi:hypothetical protein